MAGGNPSAMEVLMSAFSGLDFGGGGPSRGYGGEDIDKLRYRAELEKWAKDSESYSKAQEQHQIATAWNQYLDDVEKTQGGRLSPEMQSALSMISRFVDNPATSGMVSDVMKNVASTNLQNSQWGEDQKKYLLSKDPAYGQDFVNFVKDLKQPLVQINNGNGPTGVQWLSPEEKKQMGVSPSAPLYVDKHGDIKAPPAPNEKDSSNIQNLTTMGNALKRLDQFEKDNPNFNPSEFTDAMLRNISSSDDSLMGKVAGGLQSQASKGYSAIAKEWVSANRAILSGADVPETEFQRDMSVYFAMPNDSPQVLQMKRQMRADRVKSVEAIASLPPEQRAAAWRDSRANDELKLSGLSTRPAKVVTDLVGGGGETPSGPATPKIPTLEEALASTKRAAQTKGRGWTHEDEVKATQKYHELVQQTLGGGK